MKLAKCKVPVAAAGARVGPLKSLGAWWVQFGDEVLLYSADSRWEHVKKAASRGEVALEPPTGSVRKRDLHLVAQKGRLFQLAHPEVPVLLDKGRYLVVAIDRESASRLADPDGVCYAIQPLESNHVVFEALPAVTVERRAAVPWVQELVNRVSRPTFEESLRHLVSFPTRLSTSGEFAMAAEWARGQFMNMGYSTSLETVPVGNASSRNVVADKLGSGTGNAKLVLFVAHLDSINISGGVDAPAPGADDNGSGSAGILEMARVLKDHVGVHDLRFVLFGGEEQGLFGSKQYVAGLSDVEKARILSVVNMDMIGSLNTPQPSVLVEGAAVSLSVIEGLTSVARNYTGLSVQTSLNPFASDHVPFINSGISAVLTIEGADSANTNIHSANDVLTDIDYQLALEILRMNVGFAALALERTGGVPMQCPTDSTTIRMQFSGRYKLNGGVESRSVGGGLRIGGEPSTVHNLREPMFLDEPVADAGSSADVGQLRFNLHVDVDGSDPLNVVSGTVTQGFAEQAHFIGRVTSNTGAGGGGRALVVEDFSFTWPGTGETINRLEAELSGGGGMTPTAEVTFITTANRRHGPFFVPQESTFFREVEIEVDREDGALDAEPYDTNTHPDRPADLPRESITLESAFAKSGVRITRSAGANVIDTAEAGSNKRWNTLELHDAMESHWSAFANRPQWKMWIFAAELADEDTLGGIMFDGNIDEPGGVDRQGTALFTKSPFFHTAAGSYPQANPPAAEAATRELFFNLLHETGHAFNLAHSFQKTLGTPWPAPAWMPVISDPRALSWMNYPDQASPGLNASWFYERFRFRFDDNENLFLRHAPARYVQMGNEVWFQNHGRVAASSLDRRLELQIRSLKPIMELGEPVSVELRLKNTSGEPVMVQRNLAPGDGFVQLAITNPRGERRPYLPIMQMRHLVESDVLRPGAALYEPVKLSIGGLGSHFKESGAYRVEASYTNLDGSTAAAVSQVYVRPPASYEDLAVVNEVFNARVGRVLYMEGTRVMEDVIEKIDWVAQRLGAKHPAQYHLAVARSGGFKDDFKAVDPGTKKVRLMKADPELVERSLKSVVADVAKAADTIGHIGYERVVDTYTRCAMKVKKKADARRAQSRLVTLFKKRKVVQRVVTKAERRLKQLT